MSICFYELSEMNRSKFVILLAVFLACLAPKRVCAQIGPNKTLPDLRNFGKNIADMLNMSFYRIFLKKRYFWNRNENWLCQKLYLFITTDN